MNKRYIIVLGVAVVVIGLLWILRGKDMENNNYHPIINDEDGFNVSLIKQTYEKKNYLISPYSIEMALNLLKEGANNKTEEEIAKVLRNRVMHNLNLSKNLNIANAIFIKKSYEKALLKSYQDTLKNKYQADFLVDEFTSPKVINDWVNEKTNKMIPKILDTISSDFVLGLANAIALDVKWQSEFECNNTISNPFMKVDGSKINVEMMHQTYRDGSNVKYLVKDDLKGIILPYREDESGEKLEFIALMPNDLSQYIEELSNEDFSKIDTLSQYIQENEKVNLALPRFTYEYEIKDFIDALKNLGIHDAFDIAQADFSKIMKKEDMQGNLYVDTAIHKTKIELSETGTKAAAVTFFGIKDTAFFEDNTKEINLSFDKPFIYLIRESKTKEILFFGTVYEPNVWKTTTCE